MCAVKPHVLRYWEQEFTQLRPMKRRGNRRYYQHHEVLMIRRIRNLLYEQGFTISGARNRLLDGLEGDSETNAESQSEAGTGDFFPAGQDGLAPVALARADFDVVRQELFEIRALLSAAC